MTPVTRIGMLLLPAFNSMAAQAFIDPFRAANYLRGDNLYEWTFLSPKGDHVRASNGLLIAETQVYTDYAEVPDFLVVNASWTPERFKQRKLQHWLCQLARQGTALVGIDTGAFILAYAGVLDGYRASVHYEHQDSFRELFPAVRLEQCLFTIDHNRLSCCGGVAAVDLALEMISNQQGIDLANAVAQYIFQDRLRHGEESQHSRHHEPVGYGIPEQLREAIVLMERNLEEPLNIDEIAVYSRFSQRQLERMFRKHTGVTPVRYYINLRLNRARSLLTQTELSVTEIAGASGFRNVEQFSRAYKALFKLAPSQDRHKGRVPFQYRSFPGYLAGENMEV
ncbi:MAG: GlxA family transcriptional regulator [Thiolinea sp.]